MIAALAGPLFAACFSFAHDTTAAAALNCLTLYPTPDLPMVSGRIALLPVASPFGVAVREDGRPRQHLVATITGLPAPRTLGAYTTYVAWAYTLSLDSARKLGSVRNGRVDLGELDYAQFRILISAERSASVVDRRGRLVLRCTSPSARLLAHRDLLQPAAPGAMVDEQGMPAGDAAMRWSMPPMSPRMTMMPGTAGLAPRVSPYLPVSMPDGGASTNSRVNSAVRQASRLLDAVNVPSGDTLDLEAAPLSRVIDGKRVTLFGFNGRSPGPLLEVEQGATITVRFHNALDTSSAVHWHGLRLDNANDGVPGVTQAAVARRDTFTYTLRFPDAGLYWYHPHVREDVQQALGLYGNILVRSRDPRYDNPVDRETTLVLDDILLGGDGLTPFGAEAPTHALMGRFGNVLLVNGQQSYELRVQPGEVVRFYVTNVSSARIYNLSLPGARMKLVASDVGKLEREEWVSNIVIAPAERYVVEAKFERSGAVPLLNRVQALDHMIGAYWEEVDTLGLVRVSAAGEHGEPPLDSRAAAAFEQLRQNVDVEHDIARFRPYFDKPPDHTLILTMRTHDLPAAVSNMLLGINAPVDWNDGMPMMNWVATGREVNWVLRDAATGRENMDIDWHFHRGDVVALRIFNDPATSHAMAHPIHLHGQRFLVLRRDGVPMDDLSWKDTAIVPAGQTVDLLVDMSNPGRWMLHCHIAEHLSSGMMAAFTVE